MVDGYWEGRFKILLEQGKPSFKTVRKAIGKPPWCDQGGSQAESAELTGSATLKSMQSMAQAMNCRFVYAVIPEKEIESVIRDRAILKAKEQLAFEVECLASVVIDKIPSDLWDDEWVMG